MEHKNTIRVFKFLRKNKIVHKTPTSILFAQKNSFYLK